MSVLDATSTDFEPFIFGLVFLVIGVLAVVSYVLSSLTYYTMAKNEGMDKAWLAWIPYANMYVVGELLNVKLKGDGGLKLLIGYIILSILSSIPVLGVLFSIVLLVATGVMWYWLFQKYSDRPGLHTTLSFVLMITIIGSLYSVIALFVMRNNKARY